MYYFKLCITFAYWVIKHYSSKVYYPMCTAAKIT